ncbi:hypothetical protein HJG60_010441 [Phyllostomus discolor]|uniref:Uncharacterized protein n=1 Tax=Phyllostomus discolor TaxID=89673 RepID=A0A834EF16_9CHIR|nr:hypothetical protein HJG60_010441 [Phyllostomus discolor]
MKANVFLSTRRHFHSTCVEALPSCFLFRGRGEGCRSSLGRCPPRGVGAHGDPRTQPAAPAPGGAPGGAPQRCFGTTSAGWSQRPGTELVGVSLQGTSRTTSRSSGGSSCFGGGSKSSRGRALNPPGVFWKAALQRRRAADLGQIYLISFPNDSGVILLPAVKSGAPPTPELHPGASLGVGGPPGSARRLWILLS